MPLQEMNVGPQRDFSLRVPRPCRLVSSEQYWDLRGESGINWAGMKVVEPFSGIGSTEEAFQQVGHSTELLCEARTVATNAILENKGVRTRLITTQGFRDVLDMRRLRISACSCSR